ncbi:MAG TPA: rRNA maturation RNase YbeY [Candidatus Eremiobacteraceae bacterium]|jgi:probable rRNA maturation factor|nr:rRNA maturation RNase YbeY [Candidatus Eremiobacteraceae bacterium]
MPAANVDGPRVFVKRARGAPKRTAAFERAILRTLARAAPHVRGDVTLVLARDATVQKLNRRYRGRDATTDVLSFDLGAGTAPGEPFGDIVISIDAARRQAREYEATVGEEITRLIVHGALHLCGHDHHTRREAARMHGLSRRLLVELRADG